MRKVLNQDDELSLINQMKGGEMEAFDALYWHYQHSVYRNIFQLIKDEASAEDMLQEVFISLWEKRESIDSTRSLGGWLFISSYNRAINFLKKKNRERLASQLVAELFTESSQEETIKEMRMQELEKAIENLPQQKQRVFQMCKVQGLSYAETASILQISKHTVKEHVSGAMIIIRDQLLKIPLVALIFTFLK